MKDLTRHLQTVDRPTKQFNEWTPLEGSLQTKLNDAKKAIHVALCDNIDTRTALDVARELVTQCNIYIRDVSNGSTTLNALLLRRIAAYVTDLLHIFGAIAGPRGGIGFPMEGSGVDVSFILKKVSKLRYRYLHKFHTFPKREKKTKFHLSFAFDIAGTNCHSLSDRSG